MYITNREELTHHGNQTGRRLAFAMLEAGLEAADTYKAISSLVRIEGHWLHVGGRPELDVSGFGDQVFDLDHIRHICVIGAGKAVQRQALALEDILGGRLTGGAITVKKGEGTCLKKIEVTEGAHPIPDEYSIAGARKIVQIAQAAQEGDLVFTLFSDGASALFPLPANGFGLEDVQAVYCLTIKYGPQSIIHRIMKYFSAVNCGRIIKMIQPARTVNMVMQTGLFPRWHGRVPTEGSWIHSWPPPARRYADDVRSMQQEEWWQDMPPTMREALARLDPRYDVPDLNDFMGMAHSYWQPVDVQSMLEAVRKKADALGIKGMNLGTFYMVQSAEAANVLISMARHIAQYGQPFEPPVVLITGGELMVPVGQATGIGGRNQEFVLSTAAYLDDPLGQQIVVASADTDGTDGPGVQYSGRPGHFVAQAGAMIDGQTMAEARQAGFDIQAELRNHNSSIPLRDLHCAIVTGNTGTALGDLRLVLVLGRRPES